MVSGGEQLNGWKAIASFFGRDRTTVTRWARDRGLPVHSIPGGKTRTVYALRSELETWARTDPEASAPLSSVPPRRSFAVAAGSMLVILVASFFLLWERSSPHSVVAEPPPHLAEGLPTDPKLAALLVQAREDWARRTTQSLSSAISELQRAIRLDPGYAPAYADLADAYLLAGEAGSLDEDVAYDGAENAAGRALRLDSNLASARRALAFILYWRKHDSVAAGAAFRAALRLDPENAQTHFWYGNILADNGEHELAMREFNVARLQDPGSDQIATDYAWALWDNGQSQEAMKRLRGIAASRPDIVEAQDCLSIAALAAGDYPGYLQALEARATLRREPLLTSRIKILKLAFATGGGPALLKTLESSEQDREEQSAYPNHALAAFYASLAGDRPAVLRIMALATTSHERWGAAGFVRRIGERWAGDKAVVAFLDRLRAPAVELSPQA